MGRSVSRIAGISAVLFLLLALLVRFAPAPVAVFDTAVREAVAPLQTPYAIEAFLIITALGGGVGVILVALAFSYLVRLSTANVLRLALLLLGVAAACRFAKEAVSRARPDTLFWFDTLPSYAFPSAHAASAAALYGFIAIILYARTRNHLAWLLPVLLALLVGASRVMLGAHHASDVIGGFLLGLALLALVFLPPITRLAKKYG